MRRRQAGPGLDGILVVDKPIGLTSHDVVALVRRLTGTRRVGHGGTLDPFASGVLPVFLGRATRVVEYHLGDRKAYRATVCFGSTSTTDDLEGELSPIDGPPATRPAVEAALPSLRGTISQVPPAYSALKVGGRRAYAMARAGQSVELGPRTIVIDRLEMVDWNAADPRRPIAVLDVECSAGTYVRALARDLGAAIGCGAYLGALVRTASGPFRLEGAIPLDDVRTAAVDGPEEIARLLLPLDAGLDAFPAVQIAVPDALAAARGQYVRVRSALPSGAVADWYRLVDPEGQLVAIAALEDGRFAPDKVFVDPQASSGRNGPDLEAALAAELDAPASSDPDPASPDDD